MILSCTSKRVSIQALRSKRARGETGKVSGGLERYFGFSRDPPPGKPRGSGESDRSEKALSLSFLRIPLSESSILLAQNACVSRSGGIYWLRVSPSPVLCPGAPVQATNALTRLLANPPSFYPVGALPFSARPCHARPYALSCVCACLCACLGSCLVTFVIMEGGFASVRPCGACPSRPRSSHHLRLAEDGENTNVCISAKR